MTDSSPSNPLCAEARQQADDLDRMGRTDSAPILRRMAEEIERLCGECRNWKQLHDADEACIADLQQQLAEMTQAWRACCRGEVAQRLREERTDEPPAPVSNDLVAALRAYDYWLAGPNNEDESALVAGAANYIESLQRERLQRELTEAHDAADRFARDAEEAQARVAELEAQLATWQENCTGKRGSQMQCGAAEPPAAPVAWRKAVEPQYDYTDRYRYREEHGIGAPDGWEPLYARAAEPQLACAAEPPHDEHCDTNDPIIKGKPCNCRDRVSAEPPKSVGPAHVFADADNNGASARVLPTIRSKEEWEAHIQMEREAHESQKT